MINLVRREIFLFAVLICFIGCASAQKSAAMKKEDEEAMSALRNVASAVSGQEIQEKDLQDLGRKIQRDPEAKSAVQAITNSLSGQGQVIKYCPIDGERYSPKFTICPIHQVLLKTIDE